MDQFQNVFPPEILAPEESADFIVDFQWGVLITGSYLPNMDDFASITKAAGFGNHIEAGVIRLEITTYKRSSSNSSYYAWNTFHGSSPDEQIQATKFEKGVKIGALPPKFEEIKEYLDALIDAIVTIEEIPIPIPQQPRVEPVETSPVPQPVQIKPSQPVTASSKGLGCAISGLIALGITFLGMACVYSAVAFSSIQTMGDYTSVYIMIGMFMLGILGIVGGIAIKKKR